MSIYVREFAADFSLPEGGDGRTVFGRIVPYGETVTFVDQYENNRVKRERFVYGAMAKQSNLGAWARVGLTFRHDDGFTNLIGYGRSIEERQDGAYAAFRLYEADASKAREMIANGYEGLSLEFEPRGPDRLDSDGVIVRDSVHVRRVGITPDPAYVGAEVLALREADKVGTPYLDEARRTIAELQAGAIERLRRAHQ